METLWVALVGAVVYLDTTAVAQIMICQPLIVCPLWGWLVGRPEIGLFFGVTFQLLWLGSLPIGATKFPEGNIGALVATALAARIPPAANGEPAWIVIGLATFAGILAAYVGREVTPMIRKIMNGYAPRIIAAAEAGHSRRFYGLYSGAVGIHAAAGFLLTAGTYLIGRILLAFYLGGLADAGVSSALIAETDHVLSAIWPALLGAGVAIIVARFVQRSQVWVFLAAFIGSLVAGGLWL